MRCVAIAAAATLAWAMPGASSAVADTEGDLERGLASFQAGRFAAAIAPLSAAHAADPSDLDTGLLLGIAYVRCDDAARAMPLLVAAAASTDPETRDSAQIFLGLLADATGDGAQASDYYDRVAQGGSSLADSGRALRDRGRGARFAAGLVIRPEIDSNVALLPTTAAPGDASVGDRDLFLLGDLHVRPFDGFGLVLDETLAYRKQAERSDFDMASSSTGATWSHRGRSYRAAAGYHIDASALGGALYQIGHTIDVSARRAVTGSFGLAASYQLALRTLYPDAYAGYSGAIHAATARLSWLADDWELELGPVIAREATDDAALSVLAIGGQLGARLRLGRLDARLFARATDRRYDAAAMGRRDLQIRGDASLYVELTSHLGAVVGATLVDDRSNVMDDSYVKATGYVGLVVATAP
jgi:hypothetical protein